MPTYSGQFRFVWNCNGGKDTAATVSAANPRVFIPSAQLSAGVFRAELQHYVGGTLVKRFPVEPLLIRDVDGQAEAEPFFAQTEERLAQLETLAAALEERVTALEGMDAELQDVKARLLILEQNNDIFNT